MRRHLLGILAIVLIALGLMLMYLEVNEYVANSSWRIGLVLGALWLALPQLSGMSRFFRIAAITIAVVAAAFNRYGLILLPMLALIWIFGKLKASGRSKAGGTARAEQRKQ